MNFKVNVASIRASLQSQKVAEETKYIDQHTAVIHEKGIGEKENVMRVFHIAPIAFLSLT